MFSHRFPSVFLSYIHLRISRTDVCWFLSDAAVIGILIIALDAVLITIVSNTSRPWPGRSLSKNGTGATFPTYKSREPVIKYPFLNNFLISYSCLFQGGFENRVDMARPSTFPWTDHLCHLHPPWWLFRSSTAPLLQCKYKFRDVQVNCIGAYVYICSFCSWRREWQLWQQ